ncbi:MAG: thioredoxin family protein [Pirellulales bacterium]|nr:thioredoxin family protein [Pirellulales bacterium]
MVRTASTMLALETVAPNFRLPNVDGRMVELADFAGAPALLVIFMCNHCPYVKHIADPLAALARQWQAAGVAVVGISSNDVSTHPADSPEQMVHEAEARGYTFPYLYDEDQSVARAYHAACTPDFFLFDKDRKLAYRGQLDGSRPGNNVPVTGEDLQQAIEAVLAGKLAPVPQKASLGCNIKWKTGAEPGYFTNQPAT